jgi:hypothetical protein
MSTLKTYARTPTAFFLLACAALCGCAPEATVELGSDSSYHVYPGQDIQQALELAALDSVHKTIKVHQGTYRPGRTGQAMIWFNQRHDGITLEAVGEVVLTAANPALADSTADTYPAIVNHVVYFGDGISRRTLLRGFKITGANHFVTRSDDPVNIQPHAEDVIWKKGMFFFTDGGGIKIFGRSYPTIENVEVYDNYTSPCGGGVSIEHRGFNEQAVLFKNCVFRANRCQVTGSAVDVLTGSAALLENCLFVGNISNTGVDYIGRRDGYEYNKENGSGALTVFPNSRVEVRRCTFTGNWNGTDDKGSGSRYIDTIFWRNNRSGGISLGERYELDIVDGSGVQGCYINGAIADLRGSLDVRNNVLAAPDPQFDDLYRPLNEVYVRVGYRPVVP